MHEDSPMSKRQKPKRVKKNRPSKTADNRAQGILIYHDFAVYENFERAARRIFAILHRTQREYPGKPRFLHLNVQGHRNDAGGYDRDAYELMKDFIPSTLFPFLSEVTTPLYHSRNTRGQRNDLPADLQFDYPSDDEGFWYDIDLLPIRPREHTANARKSRPSLTAITDYLGKGPTCLICWGTPVERAHVVPVALGGSMDVRNFALLCRTHHQQAPDIADAEAFWAWVDYAELRDSGSKWSDASEEMKAWIHKHGGRTTPANREHWEFHAAVTFELQHLYGWSPTHFVDASWELQGEYHRVLEAATSNHFAVQKKVSTHAWAYHIAGRRLAKRQGRVVVTPPDHPWTGVSPIPGAGPERDHTL